MVTTIQLKSQTKNRLEKLRKKYEIRFNRKLSYDELIELLVETVEESFNRKLKAADYLFGIINGNNKDLIDLRKEDEKRLEIISSHSRKKNRN